MADADYEFTLDPVDVPRVETRYRKIVTPQPPPETADLIRRLRAQEPESMTLELPVAWHSASGCQVSDASGNTWLDFTSGIFVANAGHAPKRVRDAITEMVERPLLHTYSFGNEPRAALVEKLVEMSPPHLDCVLLLTTGAESTEAAIKLMRLNGQRQKPDKVGIVSIEFGFHGKTMGSQQAGGRPEAKEWIGQLDPNFHQLPLPREPGDFENGMRSLADSGVDLDTIAGFICEPYQGWSAAFLPEEFVRAMREWADSHGALIAFDEVQAGIGRTGRFFGHQHFGVPADLVCCGKGISSSLPLSAVLGARELLDSDPSFHSTHGGNPVCCAAALASLEDIQERGLVERAEEMGEVFRSGLEGIAARFPDVIPRVEGRGMVWALHLVDPSTGELDGLLGDLVIESCMRKGLLLVRTSTGTIKLGPPLDIPRDAAEEGIAVLGEGVAEAIGSRQTAAA